MLLINLWCYSGQCNNFFACCNKLSIHPNLTKLRVKRELINYSQSVEWKIMSISKKVLYCPQHTKKPNLPPVYYNNVKYYLEDRLKFFWCHSNESILDNKISGWFEFHSVVTMNFHWNEHHYIIHCIKSHLSFVI